MIDQLIDEERRELRRGSAWWQAMRMVGYAVALSALVWLVGCGHVDDGDVERARELNKHAANHDGEAHVCGWLDGATKWGYWEPTPDGVEWVTACDLEVVSQQCIPLACHEVLERENELRGE